MFWLFTVYKVQIKITFFLVTICFRCFERGRLKCGQYWPEHQDEIVDYGNIRVAKVDADVQNDYTLTSLDIKHTNVSRYAND